MSADSETIKWAFVDQAYSYIILASAIGVLYDHLLFILVRDSITFPLIGLVICIANLISWAGLPYLTAQISFVFALFGPCIIGSRLVLNLRESYYQPFIEECELDFAQSLGDLESVVNGLEFS